MRDSDSSLSVLPSPDILEDLRTGLNTPTTTPQHSPHAFLKEDRWLFSPLPVLTSEHINLDNFETGFNLTPHDTDKEEKSTALRKRPARPTSLVLSSEENPPRKRAKPNNYPPQPQLTGYIRTPHFYWDRTLWSTPLFTSQTSPFVCWDRTSYLEPTTLAADCITPNTQFSEKTHCLTYTICELSCLPDI